MICVQILKWLSVNKYPICCYFLILDEKSKVSPLERRDGTWKRVAKVVGGEVEVEVEGGVGEGGAVSQGQWYNHLQNVELVNSAF